MFLAGILFCLIYKDLSNVSNYIAQHLAPLLHAPYYFLLLFRYLGKGFDFENWLWDTFLP